jgi:hypothetical protein
MSERRLVRLSPLLLEVEAREIEDWPTKAVPGLDGECIAEMDEDEMVRLALGDGGFRLPTPDEWEYACSGGPVVTLFRWGDETPAGQSSYNVKGWDLHLRPNAFGL